MSLPADKSPLQIGFRDSLRSALGVLIPLYLLLSSFLIGVSKLLGIPVILSGSVLLTAGVILLIAVQIVRRYVLTSRASGKGRGAVTFFREVIRTLLIAVGPIALFLAAGVFTHCFGHVCGDTDRIMLIGMLVWSLIALAMLPMGYRLLTQADWLRPR